VLEHVFKNITILVERYQKSKTIRQRPEDIRGRLRFACDAMVLGTLLKSYHSQYAGNSFVSLPRHYRPGYCEQNLFTEICSLCEVNKECMQKERTIPNTAIS
jgi:hypothetical protein